LKLFNINNNNFIGFYKKDINKFGHNECNFSNNESCGISKEKIYSIEIYSLLTLKFIDLKNFQNTYDINIFQYVDDKI